MFSDIIAGYMQTKKHIVSACAWLQRETNYKDE